MRRILFLTFLLSAFQLNAQKKSITLEDLWRDNTFEIKSVPGFNALKDGEHYTSLSVRDSIRTIQIKSLRDGSDGKIIYQGTLPVSEYHFNKNEDKMLLLTEAENIYRRSVLHKVYVFDIASGTQTMLDTGKVLHADFSPDGSKVAFVKNNNLFYKELSSGAVTAVTTDGERNKIINGNCDWVYEEEFEFTQAYQWSPDSKTIAYYRFDETNVPEYTIKRYGALYPELYQYKYPVAGEPNSVVDIGIYNIASKKDD